ncbi:uncharacterized protein ASPGLDRAFT_700499 [Aspergillus glaucus CBS 516.65]|uniref:Zn(2)-C6 fungal-type domain-containing protein n=1 Tax=Aspergillus glaucus CBS 516.65 TaxID=1160497 RepID=A0A1L9VWS4_ASPGL|nr:hypothetical protein ASPGLDRAFT_700499 [Aspergillus glaucus CBS 516.65]OJJ88363.1 hypothetical protein ASPGLDRAFT_700499 [Aspergillus glaucus CBS 516.65]
MASDQLKPRQAKLRSSCDACGAAKLKCDRGQPECVRCVSYGISCHYGLSRKMGKPRRDRIPPSSTTQTSTLTSTEVDLTEIMPFPGVPASWDALGDGEGNNDNLMGSLDAFDQLCPSLLSSSSSHDLPPHGLQFGSISTPVYSPHLTSYCMPPAVSNDQQCQNNKDLPIHNCARDVNTTLENLPMLSLPQTHHSRSGSPSISSTDIAIGAPFDHVLRANRQVIERLSHLLTCPCAAGPSLALLYASGISRILTWYQQAACTQGGSVAGLSSTSDCGGITPGSTPSTSEFPFAPTTMAVGTFNVDDLRVQSALRMQLLLGEMRRAGGLIELFINSHTDSGRQCQDEFIAVDRLYQSLDSWLRNEHSRIASMMRGRLRELNMLD